MLQKQYSCNLFYWLVAYWQLLCTSQCNLCAITVFTCRRRAFKNAKILLNCVVFYNGSSTVHIVTLLELYWTTSEVILLWLLTVFWVILLWSFTVCRHQISFQSIESSEIIRVFLVIFLKTFLINRKSSYRVFLNCLSLIWPPTFISLWSSTSRNYIIKNTFEAVWVIQFWEMSLKIWIIQMLKWYINSTWW